MQPEARYKVITQCPRNFGITTHLTHLPWLPLICDSKLTIIGSDNGLSLSQRQTIIQTNAGILLIRILKSKPSEILSEIHSFLFKIMH